MPSIFLAKIGVTSESRTRPDWIVEDLHARACGIGLDNSVLSYFCCFYLTALFLFTDACNISL